MLIAIKQILNASKTIFVFILFFLSHVIILISNTSQKFATVKLIDIFAKNKLVLAG